MFKDGKRQDTRVFQEKEEVLTKVDLIQSVHYLQNLWPLWSFRESLPTEAELMFKGRQYCFRYIQYSLNIMPEICIRHWSSRKQGLPPTV